VSRLVALVGALGIAACATHGDRVTRIPPSPEYAASLVCPPERSSGARVRTPGRLHVTVIDTEGLPLEDARVQVAGPDDARGVTVLTDAAGRVRLQDLETGFHRLEIDRRDFARATVEAVRVEWGCLTALTVPLQPSGRGR